MSVHVRMHVLARAHTGTTYATGLYLGCTWCCPCSSTDLLHAWYVYLRITHYRRTYRNFRDGKAHGAKGETDQFHVEPDVPAVDEELLQEETFFSLSGSITKVE